MIGAVLGAGASLVGGLLDKKSNEKAANTAFNYQINLNNQAFWHQQLLTGEQNNQVNALNNKVTEFNWGVDRTNADILANHSTNSSKQTDQTDTRSGGWIDFGAMVKDAEAAGFNPLTVLRAGAAAGYSYSTGSTTSTSTYEQKVARDLVGHMNYFAMPDAAQAQNPGTGPMAAPSNAWQNAINTGIGIWQQGTQDKLAKERLAMEQNIAKAQINNLASGSNLNNANAAAAQYRMQIPSYGSTGTRTSTGGFGGSIKGVMGSVATPTEGKVTVTNPWNANKVNPNLRDISAMEERYGDGLFVTEILGPVQFVRDAWYNHRNNPTQGTVAQKAETYLRDSYKALTESWGKSPSPAAQRDMISQRLGLG